MLHDTVDRANVEILVQRFYASILKDKMVGPYFIRALGSDIKGEKWYEHLRTLNNFWLNMMGEENSYRGTPFPPHAFIGEMFPETFERWLKLFRETVDSIYVPELADKFYKKADVLAEQFMEFLGVNDEDDDDW